ncbi:MAG: calcium-binding protein [Actinomycetota bacterium]
MTRHRLSAGLASLALIASLSVAIAPAAAAATPECFGQRATIVGTNGSETLRGTARDDVIVGKGGQDVILGRGGSDLICSGGGPDAVRGDGGNDKMNGGAGQDRIYYNSATSGVTVNMLTGRASGGSGNDIFKGFEDVVGSDSPDNITGSNGQNLMSSLGGNDTVDGAGGLDTIEGGTGADDLDGGGSGEINIVWYDSSFATEGPSGPVTVDLAAGTAITPEGSDTLTDFNTAVGSQFDDDLSGTNGDNFLLGGEGNDALDGGGGFDVAIYWFARGPVTANLQTGMASGDDGNDTLGSIEGLFGGEAADTLTGNESDNFLDGHNGNDRINGAGGGDWIMGSDGTDTIDGGASAGVAYDLVDYEVHFAGPINANLQTGVVTGTGNDGASSNDTLSGVEGLFGTLFDDTLTGDASANYLYGWAGNDTISGGGGDDGLDGGVGYFDANFNFYQTGDTDTVNGGDGNDSCSTAEVAPSCETNVAPPAHPLSAEAQTVQSLRRSR